MEETTFRGEEERKTPPPPTSSHVVRITILGLRGLYLHNNWEQKWKDQQAKNRSAAEQKVSRRQQRNNSIKAPPVPDPTDLGVFVSLKGRSHTIGTKFLPPLTRSRETDRRRTQEDNIEVTVEDTYLPIPHQVTWPEVQVMGRENKFVFDTTNLGQQKELEFDIGLYPQGSSNGIVVGHASIRLNGTESQPIPPNETTYLSTTIYSRMFCLPIVKSGVSLQQLQNHSTSSPTESTSRRPLSPRAISKQRHTILPVVDAYRCKYSFPRGQGFLLVAVEVYPKNSEDSVRIEFIRQQMKLQILMKQSILNYKMVRYMQPNVTPSIRIWMEKMNETCSDIVLEDPSSSSTSSSFFLESVSSFWEYMTLDDLSNKKKETITEQSPSRVVDLHEEKEEEEDLHHHDCQGDPLMLHDSMKILVDFFKSGF